ncbi:hypothetical protein DFS34DRAFT_591025 [Phlyctochytrium arcticum]|nr:hypothetical protein DFS34DRAFT_591025 [Phlyctochytrium arcticum]
MNHGEHYVQNVTGNRHTDRPNVPCETNILQKSRARHLNIYGWAQCPVSLLIRVPPLTVNDPHDPSQLRHSSFFHTSQLKLIMSDKLVNQEALISREYLQLNPVYKVEWLLSCKALHTIISQKLYLSQYSSADVYLFECWGQSRANGYRISIAGQVLKELEQDFPRNQLPTSTQLCLAIKRQSTSRELPIEEVWEKILCHFVSRDNVVLSKLNNVFVETELIILPLQQQITPSALPSTPTSPQQQQYQPPPTKKRIGAKNEYNIPAWLLNAIECFTSPHGIDLDHALIPRLFLTKILPLEPRKMVHLSMH